MGKKDKKSQQVLDGHTGVLYYWEQPVTQKEIREHPPYTIPKRMSDLSNKLEEVFQENNALLTKKELQSIWALEDRLHRDARILEHAFKSVGIVDEKELEKERVLLAQARAELEPEEKSLLKRLRKQNKPKAKQKLPEEKKHNGHDKEYQEPLVPVAS